MNGRTAPAARAGRFPPLPSRPVSRRAVTTAGVLGSLAGLLSACGQSAQAGPRTLRILDSYANEPDSSIIGDALQAAADRVGVTLQRVSVDGAALVQRVLQQGSSGTLPDVLMLDNPNLQQIAATTALRPFDELGIPTDGYAEGITAACTHEERVYGLAPTVNTIALFYDVRALEEAGVDPPATWEELRETAAALTEGSRYGIAFCGNATYEGAWQFLPFFWTNGADERHIASPEGAQALGLLADLVADGSASSSVLNWGQVEVKDQFIAGRAAMMINGPWQIPEMSTIEDLSYDVVPLPVRVPSQTPAAPLGGEVWTVPATGNTAKEELAGEFLTAFLSDESQLEMGRRRYTVPGKPALAAEYRRLRPEMDTFVRLIEDARARTARLGADWPTTATALYTAVQLALSGQASPREALAEAEEYV
ncbi:ABC transporter substrate-binding protein [Georgenia alba]|uniref:ABC transporter substrate-binding protein n=1 Tax=Georgenia alba TaxID=2233858 RepID=A0ABW2QHX6_9MICO